MRQGYAVQTSRTGLVISVDNPWLATSPDDRVIDQVIHVHPQSPPLVVHYCPCGHMHSWPGVSYQSVLFTTCILSPLLLCSFCTLSLPIFLCLFIGCIDKNLICWDFSHLSPNLHVYVLEETTNKEATCRIAQVTYLWSPAPVQRCCQDPLWLLLITLPPSNLHFMCINVSGEVVD